jgi:hypothetical protein
MAGAWAAGEVAVLNETPEERAAYLAPYGPAWAAEEAERRGGHADPDDLPF